MDEIAECPECPECYGHGQIMDEHMMPHGDCSRCGGSGIDDRAMEARFTRMDALEQTRQDIAVLSEMALTRMDATHDAYVSEHSPNDARAEGWDRSMDERDDS